MFLIKCKDFSKQERLSKLIGKCVSDKLRIRITMDKLEDQLVIVERNIEIYLKQLMELELESE